MRTRLASLPALAALLAWSAAAHAGGTLTIDPTSPGAAISSLLRGVNMGNWVDITQPGIASALVGAGVKAVRWPGGSTSDEFHWQSNTACGSGYVNPKATFANFIGTVAVPARLQVAVTLNYGTNSACNGPGDPNEAVAWVDHAFAIGASATYWTVGNEVYGGWETDLHAKPHDPTTYAQAVATGYYPLIKAKRPNAQVGVVVYPGWTPAWDPIVLAQAKYDFVELHFYAQEPGAESDTYLTQQAPQALTGLVTQLKAELATAGHPNTPIYLGEMGSVAYDPGKQTTSITQALFAGQALAELMQVGGVARATWWIGFGGCSDASGGGNFSSSLYGWQSFGGYMIFSDGLPEYGCTNAPALPLGVPLPTAQALTLIGKVALDGEHMLPATLAGAPATVRAYAMTHGDGDAAVLFNLDQLNATTLTVSVGGLAGGRTHTLRYDKAAYDRSRNGVWAGLKPQPLGAWTGSFPVTLTPWSMTVLTITP
jgi:hypothetical protein